jgi:predicted nucleotidyltransferase
MKANLLPLRHGLIHSLKRLIKGDPSANNTLPSGNTNSKVPLVTESVESVDPCDNQQINKLFRKLRSFEDSISVFLHGSWADDTCTPFSDIDDLIVLDLEKLQQQGKLKSALTVLNAIDMNFCRVDPIQHHGHWIVSKRELENYDNSFMPVHVLNEAKHVLGENVLVAHINSEESIAGLKRNIVNTCKTIDELSKLYFNGTINAYQLKGLAGCFVLMPAFIYQVLGKKYTKPEAIKEAADIYSDQAMSCINWSGESRENWGVITNHTAYRRFSLWTRVFSNPHLWRRFSRKFSPKVNAKQKEHLCKTELLESAIGVFIKESLKYGE